MARRRGGRRKFGKAGQRRVSEKISVLRHEGVPDGHGQAGAMAASMERSGRLGRHGKYRRVGRKRRTSAKRA